MKLFALTIVTGAACFMTGCSTHHQPPSGQSVPAITGTWDWPDSLDAVRAAPKNHKVIYENERVRILEVTVRAGEKENPPYHQWPSVLIIDCPRKIRDTSSDGRVVEHDRPGPDVPLPLLISMGPEPPHSIENLDTNDFHLYRIEFKKELSR